MQCSVSIAGSAKHPKITEKYQFASTYCVQRVSSQVHKLGLGCHLKQAMSDGLAKPKCDRPKWKQNKRVQINRVASRVPNYLVIISSKLLCDNSNDVGEHLGLVLRKHQENCSCPSPWSRQPDNSWQSTRVWHIRTYHGRSCHHTGALAPECLTASNQRFADEGGCLHKQPQDSHRHSLHTSLNTRYTYIQKGS